MELVIPEQFYEFVGAITAIFGGTRIWDVFVSTRKSNHIPPSNTSPQGDTGAQA